MVPSIKIKTLFRGFSMSAMRLFLRYVAGMAVGIIPLTSSRLLVELFIGIDTVVYLEIMLGIFVLALPSILVWHILNEAIRLSNFEMKYREHITAFGVASIMMIWVKFFGKGAHLDYVELSILVCLFVFSAVLNSYLYVALLNGLGRLIPALKHSGA
tara:strand:- start:53 stop:523 length:471 start_codon:yes stop_codon:yes gene_type:complete